MLRSYRLDDANPTLNCGLIAGLRRRTGNFQIKNSEGTVAGRALQAGTGTTDLVRGRYYAASSWHPDSIWFARDSFNCHL